MNSRLLSIDISAKLGKIKEMSASQNLQDSIPSLSSCAGDNEQKAASGPGAVDENEADYKEELNEGPASNYLLPAT